METKKMIFGVMALAMGIVSFGFGGESLWYVHTGASKAVSPSDFKDTYVQGFNVGGMYGYRLPSQMEFQIGLHYNNFSFDRAGFIDVLRTKGIVKSEEDEPYLNVDGGGAYALNFYLNVKKFFPPPEDRRLGFYVYLGGGWFWLKKNAITASEYEQREILPNGEYAVPKISKSGLGIGGGIGLDIFLDEHSNFFFDVGLSTGFLEETHVFLPVKFGVLIRP